MVSAFNLPPPTVNNLDPHQRMRLVRSNRKLEAVLGTAPYYLEPESPSTSKAHRREGRFFGHSPTSSLSASSSTSSLLSEESFVVVPKTLKASPPSMKPVTKSKHGSELSRPLLLRLRTVPVPTSGNCAALLPPPLQSVTVSPTSPTFSIDLENLQATNLEHRRKKMAKLMRTLGETIPPELVFPSSPVVRSHGTAGKLAKPRHIERKPIPSSFTPSPPVSSQDSAKAPPVISRPTKSSARSRPRLPIPSPPSEIPPLPSDYITPTPRQSSKAPTLAERRRRPRPRSLSLSTGTDMLVAAAQARADLEASVKPMGDILGDAIAPLIHKDVTVVRASLDVYSAPFNYATVDEKATRDVLGSRSPLPFQTTIPAATHYQHRYAHSSPSNINFKRDVKETPRTPDSVPHHAKSASYGRPSPPAQNTKSSARPQAPSAFRQFGRRKERGWSGEWNQDMGEVVKVLRGLKAR
ncbi:hypothetical protein D9615_007349 [Tricholomella constricta]|uniref:Uncharacterized protein n=1 Tax=Tricholomella constricta TaxID=117010 RepID=A0A8H5H5K4_9AGAR|nr:hypothetical protein D9615_007349 [Tricholomella constricta]